MNIIQMQDRLKGMPEETLINYVKNPMGEVPIYLALSEIQRRNDMRDRYQASIAKQDTNTVSDKEVAKSSGIASMMQGRNMMSQSQGVGTPPEKTQMTPEMLASTGVGALPTQPIQLKEGGIIGFKNRGFISNIYDKGKKFIFGQKGQDKVINPGGIIPAKDAIPNVFKRSPKLAYGTVLGVPGAYYILGPDGEEIPISDSEAMNYEAESIIPSKTETTADDFDGLDYAREQKKLYEELLGDNEALKKIEEKLTDKEENLLSDFFIQAGFATAMGDSPNALTNISKGAMAGYEGMKQSEKDILSGQLQIAKGERAEDVAATTAAMNLADKERTRISDIEKARIMSRVHGYNAPVKVQALIYDAWEKSKIRQQEQIARTAYQKNPTEENKRELDLILQTKQRIADEILINSGLKKQGSAPGGGTPSNNQVYNVDY